VCGAGDEAADDGGAAAGDFAVVREGLGEAHGNAGADGGGHADQEGIPGDVGGEGGGEHGGQGGDGAVHEADQAGLDDLQHEAAAGAVILVLAFAARERPLLQVASGAFVAVLHLRQVAEQLADGGIGGAAGGGAVEAAAFGFHLPGGLAHGFNAQGGELPGGAAGGEAAHILPADERDVLAEFFRVQVDQAAAMLVFLRRHVLKYFGAVGVVFPQALGEVGVDAAILLLRADGQGQHFLFGELGEVFHGLPDLAHDRGQSSGERNDANASQLLAWSWSGRGWCNAEGALHPTALC
jgi:hypothetical protein